MKRYLISMKDKGFEFQTEHFINTKELSGMVLKALKECDKTLVKEEK